MRESCTCWGFMTGWGRSVSNDVCRKRNRRASGPTVCHLSYFFPQKSWWADTKCGSNLDTITGEGDGNLDQKIMVAENELLQSTANTQMKGKVLEATLITHPILKAVHSGVGSTAKER